MEILFIPDLEVALQMGREGVRKALLRGDLGPHAKIGDRYVVTRESLLLALRRRAEVPEGLGPEPLGGGSLDRRE